MLWYNNYDLSFYWIKFPEIAVSYRDIIAISYQLFSKIQMVYLYGIFLENKMSSLCIWLIYGMEKCIVAKVHRCRSAALLAAVCCRSSRDGHVLIYQLLWRWQGKNRSLMQVCCTSSCSLLPTQMISV